MYEQLTPTEYLERAIYNRAEAYNYPHTPATELHRKAVYDLLKALSLGKHGAALLLSEYYFYNYHQAAPSIAEQNKLLSIIMMNIYHKFQRYDHSNDQGYKYLIDQQQTLQNSLPPELRSTIESYSARGIEYMVQTRNTYLPHQKVNPEEVKHSLEVLLSWVTPNSHLSPEYSSAKEDHNDNAVTALGDNTKDDEGS